MCKSKINMMVIICFMVLHSKCFSILFSLIFFFKDTIEIVIMNGSRTNPNVKKDIFQDYDIQYVVEKTKSFRDDKKWIDRFGERLYMQYPEDNSFYPSNIENCYA